MANVSGCELPDHLLYDVANHLWYEPIDGGLVRFGMTSIAMALADNKLFAFTPKRVGRDFEKGKSCAVIESGKWVGPARAAFAGVVTEVNEALIKRPMLAVMDPYGKGWMLIARPSEADPLAGLLAGAAMQQAYADWMRDNNFAGCPPVSQ
ncbi:MAG: glycine cleavage system protein H [Hyphomicrobiaceae bacterium]|nr:MAG: glycine cleavage system protein H [Hyphomicrobiaceae bacterium]